MVEPLLNGMATKPQAPISEGKPIESVESVALAGAAAIQRLIADRDGLRSCATSQQREMAALTAINEELRRRIALIRRHYLELGTKILTQLEQFDQATREAMQHHHATDHAPAPVAPSDDAALVALANRLRPNGQTKPASELLGE